jgi:hypothetical protein
MAICHENHGNRAAIILNEAVILGRVATIPCGLAQLGKTTKIRKTLLESRPYR